MNMCKNIHKSIASSLAAAALLLGSAGCNDFLNVVPDDGLPSIETAFNLRSSAIRYLATCYSYMTLEGSMGNDPAMLGSDEYCDLYGLSLIHISRCRRIERCRPPLSPRSLKKWRFS